ncbi:MAG: YtxH domain-containing protein, partial [Bacteroidales bacterium]
LTIIRNNCISLIACVAGLAVGAGVAMFLISEMGNELRQHVSVFLEYKWIKLYKEEFDNLMSSVAKRFKKTTALEQQ